MKPVRQILVLCAFVVAISMQFLETASSAEVKQRGTKVSIIQKLTAYPDGRPATRYRLEAKDHGIVFRHGAGPLGVDSLGARDIWVWQYKGTYYMHYDCAGAKGWLACLATSKDATDWKAHGPVLELGKPGQRDSAAASYGVTYFDNAKWHMFYLGTPNASPPPDRVPSFPYFTMKAEGVSPAGPWKKRYDIEPFSPQPRTYYSATASPGHVIRTGSDYLMFFSASTDKLRTLGIARTRNLDATWKIGPQPLLSPAEQIENTSIYYQKETKTWFLFTNHVGLKDGVEYTDAIWVYWTKDLERWRSDQKAVVLDGSNCSWSKEIIGLPSVVQIGTRLALFYDGYAGNGIPKGAASHMHRDIALAWLELPLDVEVRYRLR